MALSEAEINEVVVRVVAELRSKSAKPKRRKTRSPKAKAQPKADPKVARFTEGEVTLTATAVGLLTKGTLVRIRPEGAEYKVSSPKGSKVVKLAHPKGEVFELSSKTTELLVVTK